VGLFLDMVYVFVLTRLTAMLADDLSCRGAYQSQLLFLAMWWIWDRIAWTTDRHNPARAAIQLMASARWARLRAHSGVISRRSLVSSRTRPVARRQRGCRSLGRGWRWRGCAAKARSWHSRPTHWSTSSAQIMDARGAVCDYPPTWMCANQSVQVSE
jgi:Bacterial low temperature requirement A protein (LtrA)